MSDVEREKEMLKRQRKCFRIDNHVTICWKCQNAVPNPETGTGCCWMEDLKPVPGWEATKRYISDTGIAYNVISCPMFKEDKIKYGKPAPKHKKRKSEENSDGEMQDGLDMFRF